MQKTVYRTPAFTLDTSDLSVRDSKGAAVRLYNKDYELLAFLCGRMGEAVPAEEILETVWDRNADYSSNVVASSASNVRKALGKDAVLTVRNRYMVEPPRVVRKKSLKMLALAGVATLAVVSISTIFYNQAPAVEILIDGINPAGNDNERLADESVALRNVSAAVIDLSGWTVSDEAGHSYRFGSRTLHPGSEVRLVTGECLGNADAVCWSFDWGYAVWNNDKDVAFVRDAQGRTVAVRRWDFRE